MDAVKTATALAQQVETQSLNSIVAGFSFASAIAYMDLVRWVITQLVEVPKNSGSQYVLTAILTTLISIIVFMIISRINGRVKKPAQPVFAITR